MFESRYVYKKQSTYRSVGAMLGVLSGQKGLILAEKIDSPKKNLVVFACGP